MVTLKFDGLVVLKFVGLVLVWTLKFDGDRIYVLWYVKGNIVIIF